MGMRRHWTVILHKAPHGQIYLSRVWVQGFMGKDITAMVSSLPLLAFSAKLKKKKKQPRNHISRIKTAVSRIKIAFIFRVTTLSNMLQKKDEPSMELLIIPELV